jgi:PAS domain S-box-containing protein
MKKANKSDPSPLRQKAEEILKKKIIRKSDQLTDSDFLKLIHELEVHKIELEERLKLAIESTGFGTYSFDFDSGEATYSKEFLDIYGLQPDDKIDLDNDFVPKAIYPEDKDNFLTSMISANDPRGTGVLNIEFRIFHTDRTIRWIRTNGLTVFTGRKISDKPLYANGIIHDITRFKESVDALWKSEFEFRSLFENSLMGVSQALPDGKLLRINMAYAEMYGYSDPETMLSEINGSVLKLYANIEDRKKILDILDEKGFMIPTELELNRRNGEKFWALVGAKKVLDSSGNLLYLQAEHIDITNRKKTQNELEESHRILFKLSQQIPGVIYQYRLFADGRSCFPYSSSGMYEIYEYSPEDVREDATHVFVRIHPEDLKMVSDLIFESARTLTHFHCEFRVNLPEKGLRWHYSDAMPERMPDESTLWHGIIYDITETKTKEIELESSREQLERLNLYLQRVREEERKLISRELHDELGQSLTAVKIDLGILKNSLSDKSEISPKLEKISSLLNDSIISVQRLTSELRPHILDDLGLVAAIDWYIGDYIKRNRINVNLDIDKSISLPAEIELVIFRILQESLTNIARHSRAENAEIFFYRKNSDVILEIKDDGIGISAVDKKSPKSLGLFNMSERAREIGGKFNIESRKKKGTRICLTVPDILFEG